MTEQDLHPIGASLMRRAKRTIPGGVNSATRQVGRPYAFSRAEGAYVWDFDGNRYTDYHAAFGAILLGHRDPRVNESVASATKELDIVGLGVTEQEISFAEAVCASIPSAEMAVSLMSGSEAVALAVRLARSASGRRILVKVQGGFHGWQDPVARNVISPPDTAYGFDPLSTGILREALEATLITEFNDIDSIRSAFDLYPRQIAAVIVEAIPHNVGSLIPTAEYLSALRELTASQGAILILDEVITGFRHGLGGYQAVADVQPDLTTFGKAVGNGYPIAGLAGRASLMEQLSSAGGSVLLAGTFNGHPIGCAAAVATIDVLKSTDHYARVFALGERIRDGLLEHVTNLGIPAKVAGFGSVFLIYFTTGEPRGYRDLLANNNTASYEFHRRMTDSGFLMLPLPLKRNHISGAHTPDDIEDTLDAAGTVLEAMERDGLFAHEGT